MQRSKFLLYHFFIPIFLLVLLSILLTIGDIDRIVTDYIYNIQENNWSWKELWITEYFLHKGGRILSIGAALVLLSLLLLSCFKRSLFPYRRTLTYLVVAAIGSSLLISILKSALAVSCPWEFERYGGNILYQTVFEQIFQRTGKGCFPSGHASAGYAWLALYFAGLYHQSRLRWIGLSISLIAGTIFGVTQQLRGAHFLSHDIWSLGICWLFCCILFLLFFKQFILNPLNSKACAYESSAT